jgi:hypothetical protein
VATSHARYRRSGRAAGLTAALAVTAALLAPATSAGAAPKPSVAATKKKLAKLNSQVDKLVDRYNKIAAAAYKDGTLDYTTSLLAAQDPSKALGQMSAFTQLSSSRSQELKSFVNSAQRLHREQAMAQYALEVVSQHAASVKKQKSAVEKAINQQKKLLPKTGALGGPIGGTYNGPASGPPREALNYARPARQALHLRRHRPQRLRLLRTDDDGLARRRREPSPRRPRPATSQNRTCSPVTSSTSTASNTRACTSAAARFIHAPHTGSVVTPRVPRPSITSLPS